MSGGLLLRVQIDLRGEDLVGGTQVLANVTRVSPHQEGSRSVLIPAGDNVTPTRFEVAPGRYVVEVKLPSGRLRTDEATVVEGHDTSLDIDERDSPHESHAWQYLSGNVQSRAVYYKPGRTPVARSMGSRTLGFAANKHAQDLPGAGAAGRSGLTVQWYAAPPDRLWSFENLNVADQVGDPWRSLLGGPTAPINVREPTETDGRSHLYRFGRDGPIAPPGVGRSRPADVETGSRQFVSIVSGSDAILATLPNPWLNRRGENLQIELLVSGRSTASGSPVAMTVRDPALGTGLAYLATGALSAAAQIFNEVAGQDVEGMLFEKFINPLAAAAGAYVLVGTESEPGPKAWHRWLTRLRSSFPWMSDGSILWGVRALRTAKSEEEVETGKGALKEAYGRGVPVYTLGLSWLIDGLSDFPDDKACARMLDQVRRLTWRVDMRQPFVVQRFNIGA